MASKRALATLGDGTELLTPQDFVTFIRPSLSRVVATANHKGGIGKTPTAVNIAARLAALPAFRAAGARFLIVDCDPQANACDDLGIGRTLPEGDDGVALAQSLMSGTALNVMRDVRPGLDVAVGGDAVSHINGAYFVNISERGEAYAMTRLAFAIAAVAHEYDMIFIDTPPSGNEILRQCFVAASRILIPVNWDFASQKGLDGLFGRMAEAQGLNPTLTFLGAVLYGFPRISGKAADGMGGQRGDARADIVSILQQASVTAPVFETVISSSAPIAETIRKRGELPHELLAYAREGALSLTLDLGGGQTRKITATDLQNCVGEWGALSTEVYQQLNRVTGRA